MDVCTQVITPLLRVLDRLHALRILHRDIKPENLFLTRRRALVVGDFGLAIRCDEELPFTRSGTLDYMAPEVRSMPKRAPFAPLALRHFHKAIPDALPSCCWSSHAARSQ